MMHRSAALIALAAVASAGACAGQTNVPVGAPPSMRGTGGGSVRAVHPPPPLPVPLDIPAEAVPAVATAIVEKMGMDGIAAFTKGNFSGAKEAYLRVLKVEPNNLAALVNLGATEYRLGNNDEAERLLRRSLQLKADNPTAWLNLGMIYLGRNDPMRALAAIAQAVVHEPNDPVARNYLGVAAGRNRWFDAAESELRRAIELRPDYADAHFNLAVFCLERVPPATELAKRHYREARHLGAEPDPLIEKAIAK
ncbi:MAG: tetratricopeptide repeat protein [Chthoniobacterales bacterium]|nr:tetratricopeptide repeat protein [Chthoniobacterales bacterium]